MRASERARVFSSSDDDDVDDDGDDGGDEDGVEDGAAVVALHNARRRRSRGLCAPRRYYR